MDESVVPMPQTNADVTAGPQEAPVTGAAVTAEPDEPSHAVSNQAVDSDDTGHQVVIGQEAEQRHEQALQAMRAGDYAEAFCLWRPLAEAGDAQAQFSLGWMYHNGYGLAIDNDRTLTWWGRAAEQGLADASFALGMLHSQGGNADLSKAVGHYLDAVRLGHGEARHMLHDLLRREPGKVSVIATEWDQQLWRLIGQPRRIKVNRANVRKGPGTDNQVMTRLTLGSELVELGREGRWVHVAIPGELVSAWVYDSLVEPVPSGELPD